MDERRGFVRHSCRQLLRGTDEVISFDGAKVTWLVILGVAPPDADTLGAALSIPDGSGTIPTVHSPSPDDRRTLSGEVFHEVRLLQVKGVFLLTDLWSIGYR